MAHKLKLKKSKEHISEIATDKNKTERDLSFVKLSEIALLYKSKSVFRLNDYSAYITALKTNCLDEICKHMIPQKYSLPQLICKYIIDILTGHCCDYDTRKILKHDSKSYELDLYYSDLNLAFEYNGKHWHSENDNTNLKLKLCKNIGVDLFIIEEDSRNYETDIKRDLVKLLPELNKKLNTDITANYVYNIIVDYNVVCKDIIDEREITEITRQYNKFIDFVKENRKLCDKLRKLKILDKYTSHMIKGKS